MAFTVSPDVAAYLKDIRIILTHDNPDIDDVVACYIMAVTVYKLFGRTVDIEFCVDRNFESSYVKHLEKTGRCLIGVGGSRFDEHPHGDSARKEGKSAAVLVSEFIGNRDEPGIRSLVDYADHLNSNAKALDGGLASMIKLAFRYRDRRTEEENCASAEKVMFGCYLFLAAIEADERRRDTNALHASSFGQPCSLDDIGAAWIRSLDASLVTEPGQHREKTDLDPKSRTFQAAKKRGLHVLPQFRRVMEYMSRHMKAGDGDRECLDLAFLVSSAFKSFWHGDDDARAAIFEDISDAAFCFLDGILRADYQFHVICQRDFDKETTKSTAIWNPLTEKRFPLSRVTSIISDSPEIGKFCRSAHGERSAVVIKYDSNGNAAVFFDERHLIDSSKVVARIRAEERHRKGLPDDVSEEELAKEGSVAGAEEWYYDKHNAFNGSLTAKLPPTRIPRDILWDIVVTEIKQQFEEANKAAEISKASNVVRN